MNETPDNKSITRTAEIKDCFYDSFVDPESPNSVNKETSIIKKDSRSNSLRKKITNQDINHMMT